MVPSSFLIHFLKPQKPKSMSKKPAASAAPAEPFSKMTKAVLIKVASQKGITVAANTKKEDIIKLLVSTPSGDAAAKVDKNGGFEGEY